MGSTPSAPPSPPPSFPNGPATSHRPFDGVGGSQTSLEAALGYDPWIFPTLIHPRMTGAYILFGWSLYEAGMCLLFLYGVRAKWRSDIYRALVLSLALHLASTVQGMIAYSSSPEVVGDYYAGPMEFSWAVFCMTGAMLSRWAYFYATMRIVLTVMSTSKPMKILGSLATVLAGLGSLWNCVAEIIFHGLCLQQYYIYKATNNVNAVYDRIQTVIVPFSNVLPTAVVLEANTMLVFMVLTKIPFLTEIFSCLNVSFAEAIKTMSGSRSIQRIVISGALSITEAFVVIGGGTSELSLAVTMYTMMFQIHTLSLLAFEGSAAIIKTHSIAVHGPYGMTSQPTKHITSV